MGFWEIVTICLVALLVLDPKELPTAMFRIGSWVKQFRQALHGVISAVSQSVDMTPPSARSDAQEERHDRPSSS